MSLGRLVLERPLAALDLETTGLGTDWARIVEISVLKLHPDGSREQRTRRLNPTVQIPPPSTVIHGIRDADVADAPTFRNVSRSLLEYLSGCDLTGFNIRHFDLPLLRAEFARCDLEFPEPGTRVVDTRELYVALNPRNLTTAIRQYCGRDLVGAHSAAADTEAAADLLVAQVQAHPELPDSIAELARWRRDRKPV